MERPGGLRHYKLVCTTININTNEISTHIEISANPSTIFTIFTKFAKFVKIVQRFAGAANLIFEVLGDNLRRRRRHHPIELDVNFIFTRPMLFIRRRSPAPPAGVQSISRFSRIWDTHEFREFRANLCKIAWNREWVLHFMNFIDVEWFVGNRDSETASV